jgi:hypothetical protein
VCLSSVHFHCAATILRLEFACCLALDEIFLISAATFF